MHLAWKLVFTHLYKPDYCYYVHDISVILQKTGDRFDSEVSPLVAT